jgi:uncharacterized repeat protein (TIGR04052 family)
MPVATRASIALEGSIFRMKLAANGCRFSSRRSRMFDPRPSLRLLAVFLAACTLIPACGDDDDDGTDPDPVSAFSLRFAAYYEGQEVGCADRLGGLGTSGTAEAEISDLRFYVSNIQFFDADGNPVDFTLDENEFQYSSPEGDVALIDLTDTSAGACAGEGLGFPEGTARTNTVVTGQTRLGAVRTVSFDVGVPQPVQKAVIENNTAEDAPSPLREMHWSWGYAYRNFVLNFTILDNAVAGEGYLHVGSTDCGGDGTKALTDRQSCGKPNTAEVLLTSFDLSTNTVTVEIDQLFANLDFLVTQDEIEVPGVSCHSSEMQTDCPTLFENLGLDITDGGASAAFNTVFAKR